MAVIASDTIGNIQGMLDRARLTQAQAKEDLDSGKFDQRQFDMVITEMSRIIVSCQVLLASITITKLTSLIPDDKVQQAEKVSKAFQAISQL